MFSPSITPAGGARSVARGLLRPPPAQLPPLRSVKLLDQVRERIRYLHYSRRTEEAYVHWCRSMPAEVVRHQRFADSGDPMSRSNAQPGNPRRNSESTRTQDLQDFRTRRDTGHQITTEAPIGSLAALDVVALLRPRLARLLVQELALAPALALRAVDAVGIAAHHAYVEFFFSQTAWRSVIDRRISGLDAKSRRAFWTCSNSALEGLSAGEVLEGKAANGKPISEEAADLLTAPLPERVVALVDAADAEVALAVT